MWPQRVTVALGVSLIAHAVFLAVWFASNGQPTIDVAHVLLGSWALAMGMQSAAVRMLHVEGVFTTAATATIIVLVGHLTNWCATVAERRRLAVVMALVAAVNVANLYYNQPLLTQMSQTFGVGHKAGYIPAFTFVGLVLGMLLFVPLGDMFERRRLITGMCVLAACSAAGVAIA